MNTQQIVKKMKELEGTMRRSNTLSLVKEVKMMADADVVQAAAISYHCEKYNCLSVPSDTMGYINRELGIGSEVQKESTPFNPNW